MGHSEAAAHQKVEFGLPISDGPSGASLRQFGLPGDYPRIRRRSWFRKRGMTPIDQVGVNFRRARPIRYACERDRTVPNLPIAGVLTRCFVVSTSRAAKHCAVARHGRIITGQFVLSATNSRRKKRDIKDFLCCTGRRNVLLVLAVTTNFDNGT
ncbi:MAG: hypothetical protein AAGD11_15340 [Planctomycetota bacterium]